MKETSKRGHGHNTAFRRALALLLASACIFALCACGAQETEAAAKTEEPAQADIATTAEPAEETAEATPDISVCGGAKFTDGSVMTWDELKKAYGITDTSIGEGAFSWCDSLTGITIPDSVTRIGDNAFFFCESLSTITLPDSVTSIGGGTFNDCNSLRAITVDEDNPNYCSQDGVLFNRDKTELICYPAGKTDNNEYTIPESVTSISNNAFLGCDSLSSITIPDSVTSIGGGAFSCMFLTDINYNGTIVQWNAIEKTSGWSSSAVTRTVHCSDGNAPDEITELTGEAAEEAEKIARQEIEVWKEKGLLTADFELAPGRAEVFELQETIGDDYWFGRVFKHSYYVRFDLCYMIIDAVSGKIIELYAEAYADEDDIPIRSEEVEIVVEAEPEPVYETQTWCFYGNFEDIFPSDMTVDDYCMLLAEYWGFSGYTLSDTADYDTLWEAVPGDSLLKDLPQDNYYLTVYFDGDQQGAPMYIQLASYPYGVGLTAGIRHAIG